MAALSFSPAFPACAFPPCAFPPAAFAGMTLVAWAIPNFQAAEVLVISTASL